MLYGGRIHPFACAHSSGTCLLLARFRADATGTVCSQRQPTNVQASTSSAYEVNQLCASLSPLPPGSMNCSTHAANAEMAQDKDTGAA